MYDKDNVFAKILDGRIASDKIYEDDKLIAINDIRPVAPIHILVIPRGEYIDFADFVEKAKPTEVVYYFDMVAKIAKDNGAEDYRIVMNKGSKAGQTVFHFHTHIISGHKNIMGF